MIYCRCFYSLFHHSIFEVYQLVATKFCFTNRSRPSSPGYDPRQDGSYTYQARSNFGGRPMPMPRGGVRGRSIGTRPFGRGARNGQSFNPRWRGNFNGQQFGPLYPPVGGQPANPRCQKCGADDMLMSYSVLRTVRCACLADALDISPKFVGSPRYSRPDGAIGHQNRQDALARYTRCL